MYPFEGYTADTQTNIINNIDLDYTKLKNILIWIICKPYDYLCHQINSSNDYMSINELNNDGLFDQLKDIPISLDNKYILDSRLMIGCKICKVVKESDNDIVTVN